MLHRYWWQNSDQDDFRKYAERFFHRLVHRGHTRLSLGPLFVKAGNQLDVSKMPNPKPGPKQHNKDGTQRLLIIHMPYHPNNLEKSDLRLLTDQLGKAITKNGREVERILWAISKAPNIATLCKKNALATSINANEII